MREGAYPNTFFQVSDNGWITKELFFEWFKLFVQAISSFRPVLLILDGHTSHITIEYAKATFRRTCRCFQIILILLLQGMYSVCGEKSRMSDN